MEPFKSTSIESQFQKEFLSSNFSLFYKAGASLEGGQGGQLTTDHPRNPNFNCLTNLEFWSAKSLTPNSETKIIVKDQI